MKTVAVVGAEGFIGREVCRALKELGANPLGIDRIASDANRSRGDFEVVSANLAHPADALQRVSDCHSLIDLAWDSLDDYNSERHFSHTLPLHYSFLQAAVESGIPRIVGVGTCFEYGMREGPLDESLVPDPKNAYAFAKHALHAELELLRQHQEFELTWARPFYLFGEASTRRSLYSLLVDAVANGEPEFKMSGGEQLRDYLPVSVAARFLAKLALLDDGAGAVNICSGEPRSVRGMVEGWIHENNWDIALDLGYYPYASHEPHAFWGDATKLHLAINGEEE